MSISVNLDEIVLRKLTLEDDTASFSCGQKDLDEYIWFQAKDQQLEGAAVVYLALIGTKILGFVSLNMSSIRADLVVEEHQPERTPYVYFPSLMIGRLAVEKQCWMQGVGKLLCQYALSTAIKLRKEVGCQFVILNAKKDSIKFYVRCGFQLGKSQPPGRNEPFMYFKVPPD